MFNFRQIVLTTILTIGLVVPAIRAQDVNFALAVNFVRDSQIATNYLNACEQALRAGNQQAARLNHFAGQAFAGDAAALASFALAYFAQNSTSPFAQVVRSTLLNLDDLRRRVEILRR
jgi:hypothetical protein